MRRLSEDKKKLVYEKLTKYIGDNMKFLIDRPDGFASSVSSNDLMSVGTCIGKFTKSGKFRLHITALHYLAPYATHKIWVKPSAEQQFLYGNNINKAGLGKITENTSKYQGVVVYSMNDLPLGFGVAAKSTLECACADPMSIICFHQADIGEYIRSEDTLL